MFNESELLERSFLKTTARAVAPIITPYHFGKTGEYKIERIAKYEFY